jgi:hypothetical protein
LGNTRAEGVPTRAYWPSIFIHLSCKTQSHNNKPKREDDEQHRSNEYERRKPTVIGENDLSEIVKEEG